MRILSCIQKRKWLVHCMTRVVPLFLCPNHIMYITTPEVLAVERCINTKHL